MRGIVLVLAVFLVGFGLSAVNETASQDKAVALRSFTVTKYMTQVWSDARPSRQEYTFCVHPGVAWITKQQGVYRPYRQTYNRNLIEDRDPVCDYTAAQAVTRYFTLYPNLLPN